MKSLFRSALVLSLAVGSLLFAGVKPKNDLVLSGRSMAEGSEIYKLISIQTCLKNRLRNDRTFLENLGQVCLRGGMPIKNPHDRQEIEFRLQEAANASSIDPYNFRENISEIPNIFGKKYLSGLTHKWGKIIFWSGDVKGLSLNGIISENAINASNAIVRFAPIKNLPIEISTADRSNIIPLLISKNDTTSLLILYKTISNGMILKF